MSTFKYEISPVAGGWQVSCNGTAGPPYTTRDVAVRDTLAIVERLRGEGHRADLRLFDIDGIGQLLELRDARLFSS